MNELYQQDYTFAIMCIMIAVFCIVFIYSLLRSTKPTDGKYQEEGYLKWLESQKEETTDL